MKNGILIMAFWACATLPLLVGTSAKAIDYDDYKARSAGGAVDHSIGLTYATGFSDVVDWYDSEVPSIEADAVLPVGPFYNLTFNMQYGNSINLGVGPLAMAFGDIEYFDLPVRLSYGYTFFPTKAFRPYVRVGGAYHFLEADYVKDKPGFGVVGTAGVQFGSPGKFSGFLEVTHDTTEATFQYMSNSPEDIKIQSTCVSLGIIF